MNRRDIIVLVICTLVILVVLVFVLGGNSKPKNGGPQPPKVTKINPNFDQTTVQKVQQNFPVDLDTSGLGRPDPFAGI